MLEIHPPIARSQLFSHWRRSNADPLEPRIRLIVGSGFVREEVKSVFLTPSAAGILSDEAPIGLGPTTVQGLEEFALGVLNRLKPERRWKVFTRTERVEWLSALFSQDHLQFPVLFSQSHQFNFIRSLDRCLQALRLSYAHDTELGVYLERLAGVGRASAIRGELARFARHWEESLEGSSCLDLPQALRQSAEYLQDYLSRVEPLALQAYLGLPSEGIHYLSGREPEPRESVFWDRVRQLVPVLRISAATLTQDLGSAEAINLKSESVGGEASTPGLKWTWESWHTFDDACARLADLVGEESHFSDHAILVPDKSENRRSIFESLRRGQIELADPREPSALFLEEKWKALWAPFRVVVSDFERTEVEHYLRTFMRSFALTEQQFQEAVTLFAERGIDSGINNYHVEALDFVWERLHHLEQLFGPKLTLQELGAAHLQWMDSLSGAPEKLRTESVEDFGFSAEVADFAVRFWESWQSELEELSGREAAPATLVRRVARRFRLRHWLERLDQRLELVAPPTLKLKPREGLRLYGTHQIPLLPVKKLWALGLTAGQLSEEAVGDLCLSERDREWLGNEFQVRTARQARKEKREALRAWWRVASKSAVLLAHQYKWDGKENESLSPLIEDIAAGGGVPVSQELGAHPRWRDGFLKTAWVRPALPALSLSMPTPSASTLGLLELTASRLDAHTRCPFIDLAQYRWKLSDRRQPEHELWGDVRGTLIHHAVQLIIKSGFALLPEDALDQAWDESVRKGRLKGLLPGRRVERLAKRGLNKVLIRFLEKEREYRARSQVETIVNDDLNLSYSGSVKLADAGPSATSQELAFRIRGKPDRIDRNTRGLWIIDYKTSSSLPTGKDMVEAGARLQLPFYALAHQQEKPEVPVCGVQFVVLKPSADRGRGIFFPETNGEEPGCFSKVTSRSGSLQKKSPDEVWGQLREFLAEAVKRIALSQFPATPILGDKECASCRFDILCGKKRRDAFGIGGEEGSNFGDWGGQNG